MADEPPLPTETGTITLPPHFKQAALLFDRIYSPDPTPDWLGTLPRSIAFGIPSLNAAIDARLRKHPPPRELMEQLMQHGPGSGRRLSDSNVIDNWGKAMSTHAAAVYVEAGHNVIPCFPEADFALARDETTENHPLEAGYLAVLENIPVVDFDAPWEPILELRSDTAARARLQRLRTWISDALSTQDLEKARDTVGQRIAAYTMALKEHGIATKEGVLAAVLNAKAPALLSAIALISGGQELAFASLAAGTVLVIGQVRAILLKQQVSKAQLLNGALRDVAYIMDIRETPIG